MNQMHGELLKLLDLQGKDLLLTAVNDRLKALTEQVAGLDAKLADAQRQVEAAWRAIRDER